MKVRIHGSIIDYVERRDIASGSEVELLRELKAQPRRRDGSLQGELTDEELLVLKTWASWIVWQLIPKKKNPGPDRGLFNSARALVGRIDAARQEATR